MEESARIVLTADRLYNREIRIKPPAVPSPLIVDGISTTHNSSRNSSS